ncbi:Uncharacterised protein [uncultured Flavonifractor sp.]|uniref:Uncharacterized protein n=1 Tax=Intestinimonas butyriciproducens TaxID=1297617 RepID=A0A0S2W4S8_9FIRM|nr:hypothetical protein [Intestinimonas butyriciproducens]ALP94337.1 hypothetical protein IB211_01946c [Intestinimonas butyriciproducens]CUQ60067.1 Uncharacterised protein [Flavonifractor plautii]SCJ50618.1 Uncharacterised protein [uncultured Flavonifractor sp.]
MKYRRIYQTLEKYGARITYDGSGWQYAGRFQTYTQRMRPLWVVAEAPKAGLRLWVCHNAGRLSVTTADMRLSSDSREYHETQKRREFHTQGELAEYLEALLAAGADKANAAA